MLAFLVQVFFCVIGATGSLRAVMSQAPILFCFCLVQILVHLIFIVTVGKLAGMQRRDLLVASNANVGGTAKASVEPFCTLRCSLISWSNSPPIINVIKCSAQNH